MEIDNPQIFDHIKGANGNIIKLKVINIGAWDLTVDTYVDIDTGISWKKWVLAYPTIWGDDDSSLDDRTTNIVYSHTDFGIKCFHEIGMVETYMRVYCDNLGSWVNTNYNKTAGPFNRGIVLLAYSESDIY